MNAIFNILKFTKKFYKWYVFMGFFVIMVSFLSLVGPLLSKQIVDLIVAKITGHTIDFSRFTWLLVAIIAADIAVTILTAFSQWMGDILTVRLQTFLSQEFYKHILSLHIGFYDNEITGQIVNKLYRGIESITGFIQNMLNNFLPFFLTALVTVILLAFYSPFIAFLLAILFPIYVLISHSSSIKWQEYENKKNTLNDLSQGRVFESISGIRVVRAFAAELAELKTFLTTRGKIESLTQRQTKKWHQYDFLRRFALNLILFAIYAYVVYWTFAGRYSLGEMTLLLQLTNQARFPLFAMSFILGQIQAASAGSADFFKTLNVKNVVQDVPGAGKLKMQEPLIEFENVSFEYESGKQVLKNINFKVLPREKLALVGASGQGKSTLINLLLRYYEPQRGEICINHQNIARITQSSLHENIAVVFQESLLFSGTVYENIIYGKPDATKDEVVAAATSANCEEFIKNFPDGYESLIGERGVKLSGGQKQRLAIARAFLKNAPIILLDEATSSLDSKSELLVQKGLDRLLSGRTAIIIAHRLSTIASADHILVLEKGQVSQYGTGPELLAEKDGLYAQLVDLQQKLLTATPEEKQQMLQKFDLVE